MLRSQIAPFTKYWIDATANAPGAWYSGRLIEEGEVVGMFLCGDKFHTGVHPFTCAISGNLEVDCSNVIHFSETGDGSVANTILLCATRQIQPREALSLDVLLISTFSALFMGQADLVDGMLNPFYGTVPLPNLHSTTEEPELVDMQEFESLCLDALDFADALDI